MGSTDPLLRLRRLGVIVTLAVVAMTLVTTAAMASVPVGPTHPARSTRDAAPGSRMTLAQAPPALRAAVGATLGRSSTPAGSRQQAKLTASDGASNDQLGYAVAISGSTAVVGARFKGSLTGAAYVFVRTKKKWSQQAELIASDGAPNDQFGSSVAISGDTAVVGAPAKDSFTGAAYVFVRSGSTWSEQAELGASGGASFDFFGFAVAVSGDTAVVGADGEASFTGAAYVFVRSGTWSQQAKLTASDGAPGDSYGVSVALSGSTALIGAFAKGSHSGAAYVVVRSKKKWSQQAELTASDGAPNDLLGYSVAVSGSTAVAGAYGRNGNTGAAYVFVRSGGIWSQQAELTASDGAANDKLGISVALDSSTAVAGAWGRSGNTGAAYVFVRSGSVWSQHATLTASDGAPGDNFGFAVAISGSTAVAGAFGKTANAGAAYVFVKV